MAGEAELPMSVLLSYQNLSDLFMNIVSVLVVVLYVIMGATLDLEVIKMIVKKPIGPMVGIVCQYLFMPLVSVHLLTSHATQEPLFCRCSCG